MGKRCRWNNWGMEAIDAPGAWEYREQLRTVNIGVFDIMFDTNHEDLNFAEDPYKNAEALEKVESGDLEWSNHGTHVAGTIAATFNNKKGIAGVIPKVNLYGASVRGIQIEEYCTAQAFNTAFYYLIVKKGCSAVNLSLGMDALVFGASRHEKADTEILGCLREEVEEYLKKLIDKNYSFVICAASGNMNESGGGYRFFRRDDDDTSQISEKCPAKIIAEGHIHYPEQAKKALEAGAFALVVGGAITRPAEITSRFVSAIRK